MAKSKPHDIKSVLILGSGPIVIGQACEFDYSGTQACRALREEGIRVVLLNSNPATIMTDPEIADRTYIEPLDPLTVRSILREERVDAILPTMGGQTGLNLVLALSKIPGALDDVRVIGANLKSIHLAEDRRAFREVVGKLGLESPRSTIVRSVEECQHFAREIGYPFILRPSFTLGGTGQGFVFSEAELADKTQFAINESPIGEVLVEESVLGWKEYELEVMRDVQDNAIVVCSIENLDAMGIHTGESITVAPQQTLTDREYQSMRSDALKIVRAVGVATGGCNVQFAVHPQTGRRIVIEMNPRVSRSSALASKATGFPIAYVATKLALGYRLSDIDNTVTGTTKACFEPPIDYVALKIPRWHFEKFPGANDELLSQMQSVGEVLTFGGSVGEAFHKGLNALEQKWPDFGQQISEELLTKAHSRRGFAIWDALATGLGPEKVAQLCGWDPWFLREIRRYQQEESLGARATRYPQRPARFQMIDTCSAETRARTPFFYSTRERLGGAESVPVPALQPGRKGRVVILGSGPNRIGQGVEFDYCCVHASLALQRLGYETVMVNCNPETVSTDPSVSTRLYLEPLAEDAVKAVLDRELSELRNAGQPAFVLVQTGGQTPLKLAAQIRDWGYAILGTSTESIDLSEDRDHFAALLQKLDIVFPPYASATSKEEAVLAAERIGYPILVRPSFVLGGRGMRICTSQQELEEAYVEAKTVSEEYPLYLDKFLMEAVEFDIDGICDGKRAWVAGVMEHVEEAGIHSGDSSCVIPPFRLPPSKIDQMAGLAKRIAVAAGAKGFFNIQMAVMGERIFVLESNPRASRTVPFLAKATGYPVVEMAMRAALGELVEDIVKEAPVPGNYRLPSHGYAVKIPVFPFNKFRNVDPVLGPEMRSTGESMGMAQSAGAAFAKGFAGAGVQLPTSGKILLSIADRDKARALSVAKALHELKFQLVGTPGTADFLRQHGLPCERVEKIGQNTGKEILRMLREHEAALVINTPNGLGALKDGRAIRTEALRTKTPLMSTVSAAEMAVLAIQELLRRGTHPVALQDFIASSAKA